MGGERRLQLLPGVSDAFDEKLAEHEGRVTAYVTTATPLKPAHKKSIEKSLADALKKKITIEENIDAGILGGVTIQVGSQFYDASLSGKLARLQSVKQQPLSAA